jgi:hypothetical protein
MVQEVNSAAEFFSTIFQKPLDFFALILPYLSPLFGLFKTKKFTIQHAPAAINVS